MSTAPVTSLTVKEQAALPTTVDGEYSLVLALSDAGVKHMGNQTPRLQGRPLVEDNTVYLWQSGCLTDNVLNCDLACMTPHKVWNGTNATFTYQNCLLQPILALSAAEKWLVEDPPGLLDKYGISTNLTTAVGHDPQQSLQWTAMDKCTEKFCKEIRPNSDYCFGGPGHRKLKYALGGFDPPWYPIVVSPEAFHHCSFQHGRSELS
jgi:hypothetical protein